MAARLKERYEAEIRPAMVERFGYSSTMQAPKIEKITVNMGVGDAKQDSKMLEKATLELATITGQQPNIRRATKSIAQFKLREGMPVGLAVTLRGDRLYEFLDRLMSVAIPRIRDFRGLSPKSCDGRGNFAMGVREQVIFPEIDYDNVDQVRGLDIVVTTSAKSDEEAYALLEAFGMPFAKPAVKKPAPVAVEPAEDVPVAEEASTDEAAQADAPEVEAAEAPEAGAVEAEEAPTAEADESAAEAEAPEADEEPAAEAADETAAEASEPEASDEETSTESAASGD